jgi:tetratricopeptide (TPR) repeat protein
VNEEADPILALTRQAQAARNAGDREAAVALQSRALALCRHQDDPARLAHVLRHLGDILGELGRYAEAEPHFREMAEIYAARPQTPPLELANAWRSLAVQAEGLGDRDDARRLWMEVRARYAELDAVFVQLTGKPENPGVAECDRRLGRLAAEGRPAG